MRKPLAIRYTPRLDITPEAELDALANVYRFILDRQAKKTAAEPNSGNDAATVRNPEGVSHVEQRPDRSSEAVVTHLERAPPA